MTDIKYDIEMNAEGLMCPEPVMMLHVKIKEIDINQVIKVRATDPSTTRDIVKFCHFLGHELLHQDQIDKVYEYFIRKGK